MASETSSLLAKINNLNTIIVNGIVTPELQAAVDAVVNQAKVVDDLASDAPVIPVTP